MSQFVDYEWKKECEGIIWDYIYNPPRKIRTKYLISRTNEKEIMYTLDGCSLKIDRIIGPSKELDLMNNLEQIKHLQWIGQYGQNNVKIGKWIIRWNGETLKDVGGQYSNDGKKQGRWIELFSNYWNKA
ncbi:unnamed protein product [Paramecium pentaurelia]|nr:unnamed protein product [Paramecium pentaurelia]